MDKHDDYRWAQQRRLLQQRKGPALVRLPVLKRVVGHPALVGVLHLVLENLEPLVDKLTRGKSGQ